MRVLTARIRWDEARVDEIPDGQHPVTVIGVVADTRINGLKNTALMVYVPNWAFTPWTLSFLVRSTGATDALIPEIRKTIWNIDPLVAIPELKSMDEKVDESVATDRFQAVVLTSFGGAALLLALLGVYGVMAYGVAAATGFPGFALLWARANLR